MTRNALIKSGSTLAASILVLGAAVARADDAVLLSLTIKDHRFAPTELHGPAGKSLTIEVENLDSIAAEFESSALHFEKVIPAGGRAVVHVRPLTPGRYNFFDDFHRQTQGFLVVP